MNKFVEIFMEGVGHGQRTN